MTNNEYFCNKIKTPPEIYEAIQTFSSGADHFIKWCRTTATADQIQIAYDSIHHHHDVYRTIAKEELERKQRLDNDRMATERHTQLFGQGDRILKWTKLGVILALIGCGIAAAQWLLPFSYSPIFHDTKRIGTPAPVTPRLEPKEAQATPSIYKPYNQSTPTPKISPLPQLSASVVGPYPGRAVQIGPRLDIVPFNGVQSIPHTQWGRRGHLDLD